MNHSTSKDFNLVKAEQLCLFYIKNRQAAKTEFLTELISYQHFFGETSILNCKLGLSKRYLRKTAECVLSDLGYKLIHFCNQTNSAIDGSEKATFSVITFTTAEG